MNSVEKIENSNFFSIEKIEIHTPFGRDCQKIQHELKNVSFLGRENWSDYAQAEPIDQNIAIERSKCCEGFGVNKVSRSHSLLKATPKNLWMQCLSKFLWRTMMNKK